MSVARIVFVVVFLLHFIVKHASGVLYASQTFQILYETVPKIRIALTGLTSPPEQPNKVVLWVNGTNNMVLHNGVDFEASCSDDYLILRLNHVKNWCAPCHFETQLFPSLTLVSVSLMNSEENVLYSPTLFGRVIPTPSVFPNVALSISKVADELKIMGTGIKGARKADLYFNPPLYKEIAYELVSSVPFQEDKLVLRLRYGYEWREDIGPLSLVGLDTGGGPVKLNGDDGVIVANIIEVVNNNLQIFSTANDVCIYDDTPEFTMKGIGFSESTDQNKFIFSNGIQGGGVNYTIASASSLSVVFRLTPGLKWSNYVDPLNPHHVPGYSYYYSFTTNNIFPMTLTLRAVNIGQGFVAVGPAKKGLDVATVVVRPTLVQPETIPVLFQSKTPRFVIYGTGFTNLRSPTAPKTQITFSSNLICGIDYDMNTVNSTSIEIILKSSRRWSATPGPLFVTAINTRWDHNGWFDLNGGQGVHVADVVVDYESGYTGGVTIQSTIQPTYEDHSIEVTGSGFKEGIVLTLEEIDYFRYRLQIVSPTRLLLVPFRDYKWRTTNNKIIVKSIILQQDTFPIANGIQVATIIPTPYIESSGVNVHQTQTKLLKIKGRGFNDFRNTNLTLIPAPLSGIPYYKVKSVTSTEIVLQLLPNQHWPTNDFPMSTMMKVTAVNTGAGDVVFRYPVSVALIIADLPGVYCDDSCEFAFDGVCDDGSLFQTASSPFSLSSLNDDYYANDDNNQVAVSACVRGTDCTDCGGIEQVFRSSPTAPTTGTNPTTAVDDYSNPTPPPKPASICTNTCAYRRDGVCDDPRGTKYCAFGSDCQDCGPSDAANFTNVVSDDPINYDDDDDQWSFNDKDFLNQSKGLDANRARVRTPRFNKKDLNIITGRDVLNEERQFIVVELLVFSLAIALAVGITILTLVWLKNGRTCRGLSLTRACDLLNEMTSDQSSAGNRGTAGYQLVSESATPQGQPKLTVLPTVIGRLVEPKEIEMGRIDDNETEGEDSFSTTTSNSNPTHLHYDPSEYAGSEVQETPSVCAMDGSVYSVEDADEDGSTQV